MDLTKLSEREFICENSLEEAPADPSAFFHVKDILSGMIGTHIRSIGSGYEIYEVAGQPGDVVLILNHEVVGCYFGELLAIDPDHKGKNLSTPLILAAIPNRQPPTERKVSAPGLAALRKAWRVANGLENNPWP